MLYGGLANRPEGLLEGCSMAADGNCLAATFGVAAEGPLDCCSMAADDSCLVATSVVGSCLWRELPVHDLW